MLVIIIFIIDSKYPLAETEINNSVHINNPLLPHIFLPKSSDRHTSPISFHHCLPWYCIPLCKGTAALFIK